jgi:hypothetical protein
MRRIAPISLAVGVLAGCANTTPVAVPQALAPSADETFAMIVPARGVQIYECRARKDGGSEWAFVAPDAELFDARGNAIGRHGAGPFWEARDGSRVVGTVKARTDAPAAGAVPWLLLATKSTGPDGTFGRVTSIQRVNTVGGISPTSPCTNSLQGSTARVPYTADYVLFTTR